MALVVDERERSLLANLADQERWDLHFVPSFEVARRISDELSAPVLVYDRDWPGTDWRSAVQLFAAAPHQACVILASSVVDEYLWEEVVRQGGYDVVAKPLRAPEVARVIKLALSYWNSTVSLSS